MSPRFAPHSSVAEVTIIERAELGGTLLELGCIPTKSLLAGADLLRKIRDAASFGIRVPEPEVDFPRMMERKEEIVLAMAQRCGGGVQAQGGEGRSSPGPCRRRRGRHRRRTP